MELRSIDGRTRFVLTVLGYQFPNAGSTDVDSYDANWLMVKFHFDTPEFRWTSIEPCLLTWEAAKLADWLTRVADQAPHLFPTIDYDLKSGDALVFMEPNLGFSVVSYPNSDSAVVRVHVSFVALQSENLGESQDGLYESRVDIEMSRNATLEAATDLRGELLKFPTRQ